MCRAGASPLLHQTKMKKLQVKTTIKLETRQLEQAKLLSKAYGAFALVKRGKKWTVYDPHKVLLCNIDITDLQANKAFGITQELDINK